MLKRLSSTEAFAADLTLRRWLRSERPARLALFEPSTRATASGSSSTCSRGAPGARARQRARELGGAHGRRVIATVARDNAAWLHILERLGLVVAGELDAGPTLLLREPGDTPAGGRRALGSALSLERAPRRR